MQKEATEQKQHRREEEGKKDIDRLERGGEGGGAAAPFALLLRPSKRHRLVGNSFPFLSVRRLPLFLPRSGDPLPRRPIRRSDRVRERERLARMPQSQRPARLARPRSMGRDCGARLGLVGFRFMQARSLLGEMRAARAIDEQRCEE